MTAFATGTAANAAAFFTALNTFLTANADLVAAGEAWTVAASHSSTEKVYQGPGLAGDDAVLIGLKLVSRPTPDEYEIQITGMSGVLASSTTFDGHINTAPTHVRCFLDSNPMDYWFVANGRRFAIVVKISTVFQAAYAGFFLPYAAPTEYAYPLFIGGTVGQGTAYNATSWRSVDEGHRHFPHSYYESFSGDLHPPAALMMDPEGNWLNCAATGDETHVAIAPRRFHAGFGVSETSNGGTSYGYADIRQRLSAGFDDALYLTPLTLLASSPSDQTYGVLQGCFHVPGFGNSSENIITVDGVDHLTVQDAFRTEIGEYWALALE